MAILTTVAALRGRVREARGRGREIGLVPTMGALHEGHLSLVRRARDECGLVVVSLFVNPIQFGPNEDLARYPRDLERDYEAAVRAGAGLLFAPPVEEVYPPGAGTFVTIEGLTEGLCGAFRPGHFRGVATVVAALFNMVQPDRAYFGEKDFQQLQVIRKMVRDLHFPVQVVPCPIVREPDGLAMSSRNRYLSPAEREQALALSRGLAAARDRFRAGERDSQALLEPVRAELARAGITRIDYVELVDADTLQPVPEVVSPALLALAAHVGTTRLIDNILLTP